MGGASHTSGPNVVYRRSNAALAVILALMLFALAAFVFFVATQTAFEKTGFTGYQFLVILGATLLGSYVDIPVWTIKNSKPYVALREVRVFWVTYRIPEVVMAEKRTVIAVNAGGALVPLLISSYLLYLHPTSWLGISVSTALTAVVVRMVARYVEGVGVVAPSFLPPIAAVFFSIPFGTGSLAVTAYVAGTVGTLVGADLANLGRISEGGASVASIGGAGKFDGIFLTGIVAVLIASLI